MPLGYAKYEIKFELITNTPNLCQEGEITHLHTQILEKNINKIQPIGYGHTEDGKTN